MSNGQDSIVHNGMPRKRGHGAEALKGWRSTQIKDTQRLYVEEAIEMCN